MSSATLIMNAPHRRKLAAQWAKTAPDGTVIVFRKPGRTPPQNDRMWAMLTDVSRQAEHNGRRYTPDQWKQLFMHACGHEAQFMSGLNGEPFPAGFRSSKLTKEQMSELMDFIDAWCAQNGICLQEAERA